MHPALAAHVERLWFSSGAVPGPSVEAAAGGERVLPTGAMHVVVRLSDAPLVLVTDGAALRVGHAVVGGARSSFYDRDTSAPSVAVGAMLRPGAAQALFGVAATELAHRHTPLDALVGPAALASLRDELAGSPTPLRVFERFLVGLLRPAKALPAAVAEMLRVLDAGGTVAAAVRRAGFSHRACVAMFGAAVGLGPKAHARVRRFQRALVSRAPLAAAAWANGYADQAHLCRDFAAIAGITPSAHRRLALASPNHVPWPLPAARGADFSKTQAPRADRIHP